MSIAYPAARILVSLANISVAAIVILSILPLVTDQFKIDAPAMEDFDWSFSDGNVTLAAPIGVNNGGFFDINDVVVSVMVSNVSGGQMLSAVNQWGTIPSGGQVTRQIRFALDLDRMLADGFAWMITHSDLLRIRIEVTAKYTLKLIAFSADCELHMPWDGLVQDVGFRTPSLFNDTGSYGIQIPYYLKTADFLQGLGGNYSVKLYNGTGSAISSAGQDIQLGTNYSGNLSLAVNSPAAMDLLVNNQTLIAEITVRLPSGTEVTIDRRIEWAAPMHW